MDRAQMAKAMVEIMEGIAGVGEQRMLEKNKRGGNRNLQVSQSGNNSAQKKRWSLFGR